MNGKLKNSPNFSNLWGDEKYELHPKEPNETQNLIFKISFGLYSMTEKGSEIFLLEIDK